MTFNWKVSRLIYGACGVWLVLLGLYFVFLRPPLLAEDLAFMEATPEHVRAAIPRLPVWLSHVFTVMGGFMLAAGVQALVLARRDVREIAAEASTGLFTVGLMAFVNFEIHSGFRWVLLLPALAWAFAVSLSLRDRMVGNRHAKRTTS